MSVRVCICTYVKYHVSIFTHMLISNHNDNYNVILKGMPPPTGAEYSHYGGHHGASFRNYLPQQVWTILIT